ECLDDSGDGTPAEVGLADVTGNRDHPAAEFADAAGHGFGVFVFLEVEDGDVGPLAREEDGRGATNAAVGAGEHGDLALEFPAGPVLGILIDGLRADRLLASGERVFLRGRWAGVGLFGVHESGARSW